MIDPVSISGTGIPSPPILEKTAGGAYRTYATDYTEHFSLYYLE
jgi:hypothetical protein